MRNEVTSAATGAACVCFKHPGQAARALETIQHQAAGVPGALKVRAKVQRTLPFQTHQHLGGLGDAADDLLLFGGAPWHWPPFLPAAVGPASVPTDGTPQGRRLRAHTKAGCTQRELRADFVTAERCGCCRLAPARQARPACGALTSGHARAQVSWARDREQQTSCLLVGNLSGDVGDAALLGACYARGAGWGLDARIAPAPPAAVTHGFVWFACAPSSAPGERSPGAHEPWPRMCVVACTPPECKQGLGGHGQRQSLRAPHALRPPILKRAAVVQGSGRGGSGAV